MDRRFDRLQRTKVDKSDLARFATKQDLARFATKQDLARFATRDELSIQFAAMHRQFESLNSKVDSLARTVATNTAIMTKCSRSTTGGSRI